MCTSKLSSNRQIQQHVNHQQTSIQHTSEACGNTISSNIPGQQEVSQHESSIQHASHTPAITPGCFPQATDSGLESFVSAAVPVIPGLLPDFEFTEHVSNKPTMNQEAYFLHRSAQPLQIQPNIQQQATVTRFFINDSEGNPVVITLPNDMKFITMPGPPERNNIVVSAADTCEKVAKLVATDIGILQPEILFPKMPEVIIMDKKEAKLGADISMPQTEIAIEKTQEVFVMQKCSEQSTAVKAAVMNEHLELKIKADVHASNTPVNAKNQTKEKQVDKEKNSEAALQQTEQENDLKKKENPTKTIEQTDEKPVVETNPKDNSPSSSVPKNEKDLGGNDETEKLMQKDVNVLNDNVSTGLEKAKSTGVRQHFVNYFGETFKKHNAVLIQKGKTVLPLCELCRLYLGLNNDICSAMSSYMKMNAYFKKFHSTGKNNVTKTEKDDLVTIQIHPGGFYAQPKERKEQESKSESEGTGANMKRSKSLKGMDNRQIWFRNGMSIVIAILQFLQELI